jgi:peroxiredoxin
MMLMLCPLALGQELSPADAYKAGHSAHGGAFDEGPRQKPWALPGIGRASFPITTKNAEVQKWFNQGNALLHSFWFYEAERAFRWCLKLEPDNAMAYWGLAVATTDRRASGKDRAVDFIREAAKRKATVTDRERLYIEAWEAMLLPDPLQAKDDEADYERRRRNHLKKLETLCVKYPDDLEAKAYLALATMGDSRYGAELMIREIVAKQPDHPGAHHYRIHNWDYHEPEQALVSCRAYTDAVPGIGHAQHMPGHIYSIVGMWDEAALSMDAATRVEKKYMQDSLTFPFNNWNYGHNRNYLSYIQEQLGMAEAALFGARQLIDAPLDPLDNADSPNTSHSYGLSAMARVLLKFERYDELLKGKIPWRDLPREKAWKAYYEARAQLATGKLDKAETTLLEHAALKKDMPKDGLQPRLYELEGLELRARLAIARGQTITGLGMLAEAAEKEYQLQKEYADPPFYPEALYNALGEQYLLARSPTLAAQSFEKALTLVANDIFSLSGLVRAYAALGETSKAQSALARLMFQARNADPKLKIIESARAAGIQAEPRDSSPAPQRDYKRVPLESYGPARWEPYNAPKLEVTDPAGKRVTLDQYKGKNVILVFYLGQECPHCMKQLGDIGKKNDDWDKLDTVVLAVSSTAPAKNQQSLKSSGALPIGLLSDNAHENARRFHSYDDMEDMELHSTLLIDRKGRVYWGRFGGEPFGDLAFLEKQLGRMNELVAEGR